MKGKLIIISSPSGGGKGSLIKEVRAMLPELGYSVSHTTRPQRPGEEDGREYFFVTRDSFESMIANNEFLEYAEVHGNLYGTSSAESKKVFSTGKDLVVEVDVQGAVQIMDRLEGEYVSVFILPPSFEVLAARLRSRGTEEAAEVITRLRNAFSEVRHYPRFNYVVVNEVLSTAAKQIAAIIIAERQTPDRQTDLIRGILDSFEASKHRYQGD